MGSPFSLFFFFPCSFSLSQYPSLTRTRLDCGLRVRLGRRPKRAKYSRGSQNRSFPVPPVVEYPDVPRGAPREICNVQQGFKKARSLGFAGSRTGRPASKSNFARRRLAHVPPRHGAPFRKSYLNYLWLKLTRATDEDFLSGDSQPWESAAVIGGQFTFAEQTRGRTAPKTNGRKLRRTSRR